MIRLKAVIADDEAYLRQSLSAMLNELWPELHICQEVENGIQALEAVKKHRPDMVFLDIKMPGMSGVAVAKRIYDQCKIIFVTAYDHYAVEAFDTEAFDYILKPVNKKRLARTIDRLKQSLQSHGHEPGLRLKIQRILQVLENRETSQALRLIKVKHGTELRFIPVSDIYFFMADDKYTIVKTRGNEFLIKTPIRDLETQLDPDQFWRVHRSSIINIDKIKKIKRSFTNQMMIVFDSIEQTIPVSRSCEHLFRQM